MSWYNTDLKKVNGKIVPQEWDESTNDWKVKTTDPDEVTDATTHTKLDDVKAEITELKTIMKGTNDVSDANVLAKLTEIETALNGVLQTEITNFPSSQSVEIENFPENQPVNDAAVLARLEAIETRLNGVLSTQLTGSNVAQPVDLQYANLSDDEALPVRRVSKKQTVMVIDALEKRDTSTVTQRIDLKPFKEISLWIQSSLDVECDFALWGKGGSMIYVHDGSGWKRQDTQYSERLKIPGDNMRRLLNTHQKTRELLSYPHEELYLKLFFAEAPTAGNITVEFVGVPV